MDLVLIYLWHGSLFAGGTRGVQNAATTEHCNITISTLIGGVLGELDLAWGLALGKL